MNSVYITINVALDPAERPLIYIAEIMLQQCLVQAYSIGGQDVHGYNTPVLGMTMAFIDS